MDKLVFATRNLHKVEEVSAKLGGIPLVGLDQIGCLDEIEETGSTLEENARIKAHFVWDRFKRNVFADDTGLEVWALNMAPGVRSARYAGEGKNSMDNMNLLLENLSSEPNRKARFRTVICLIIDGNEYLFEGIVDGHITREKRGELGFGYDPIFVPEGNSRSFAQMNIEEKNLMSHRGRALGKMKEFLAGRMK